MSVFCAVTHRKEDAAKKWCPFAWTRNYACRESAFSCKGNPQDLEQCHNDEQLTGSRCLTNRCMAWIDETDYFQGIAIGRCGLVSLSRI